MLREIDFLLKICDWSFACFTFGVKKPENRLSVNSIVFLTELSGAWSRLKRHNMRSLVWRERFCCVGWAYRSGIGKQNNAVGLDFCFHIRWDQFLNFHALQAIFRAWIGLNDQWLLILTHTYLTVGLLQVVLATSIRCLHPCQCLSFLPLASGQWNPLVFIVATGRLLILLFETFLIQHSSCNVTVKHTSEGLRRVQCVVLAEM